MSRRSVGSGTTSISIRAKPSILPHTGARPKSFRKSACGGFTSCRGTRATLRPGCALRPGRCRPRVTVCFRAAERIGPQRSSLRASSLKYRFLNAAPASRVVAEPLAELGGRSELLQPRLDRKRVFLDAAWPHPVDEVAFSVALGSRSVGAFHANRHDPSIEDRISI